MRTKRPTQDLAEILWDYHKALYGVRPRHIDHTDRQAVIQALEACDREMARRRSTPAGRNILRAEGWVINTPPPEADGYFDKDLNESNDQHSGFT